MKPGYAVVSHATARPSAYPRHPMPATIVSGMANHPPRHMAHMAGPKAQPFSQQSARPQQHANRYPGPIQRPSLNRQPTNNRSAKSSMPLSNSLTGKPASDSKCEQTPLPRPLIFLLSSLPSFPTLPTLCSSSLCLFPSPLISLPFLSASPCFSLSRQVELCTSLYAVCGQQ